MASLIALPQLVACSVQNRQAVANELRERDETRQTFKLTPGARVEVSNIRGSLEVETADTEVAEVHIVRSAQSRAALEQYKVGVENRPQSLIVRGETNRRDTGSDAEADVRHQVMLRLPRRVDLSIQVITSEVKVGDVSGQLVVGSVGGDVRIGRASDSRDAARTGDAQHGSRGVQIGTVAGSLNIEGVDGQLQVTGVGRGVSIGQASRQVEIKTVTGDVRIGHASDSLNVTGVSGTLSAGISKLGPRGLQISTVAGHVELRFRDELNAQLSTDSIIGELSIDLPNFTVKSRPDPTALRAMIGKGGPLISIKGVSKNVRLVKGS
jgi:hypothetical protein